MENKYNVYIQTVLDNESIDDEEKIKLLDEWEDKINDFVKNTEMDNKELIDMSNTVEFIKSSREYIETNKQFLNIKL